jgi:hypothetical protein
MQKQDCIVDSPVFIPMRFADWMESGMLCVTVGLCWT